MAYYDENGRITIDENAAASDIRKINEAVSRLNASVRAMDSIISHASTQQGMTAQAAVNKASEMKKELQTMIGRLNETAGFINRTVAHYRQVDKEVREMIRSSNPGGGQVK